ncbi:MAG: hypothetical protein KAW92_13165 [Candidatus Cloacimonetes bacterium]|nr:hypothetical protein [Candidatus Cloacimonadota bacterium]
MESVKNGNGNVNDVISEVIKSINQNQDSTFSIMDYLQFQDITNQQIQGVLSVLSETENKLNGVLSMLTNLEGKELGVETKHVIKSFNDEAEFKSKQDVQKLIDDLFD